MKNSKENSNDQKEKSVVSKAGKITSHSHASVSHVEIVVGWNEVERLLNKEEYAAAMLVTAVNAEFTLRRNLRKCKVPLQKISDGNIRSIYGKIKKRGNELSLGSLYKVAKYLVNKHDFEFHGDLKKQIKPVKEHRKDIAHTVGYFAKFTKLNIIDRKKIKELIQNARSFCEANPA